MDLKKLKGLGQQGINYLEEKEITSIEDLITFYPINYQVYKNNDLKDGINIKIKGTITKTVSEYRPKRNLLISTYYVFIGDKELKVIAWNQKHLRFTLSVNDYVEINGKYDEKRDQIVQSSVKKLELSEEESTFDTEEEIVPIYSKVKYLTNYKLRKFIIQAIDYVENDKLKDNLKIMHSPPSFDKLEEAKNYLKYCEFYKYYEKLQKLQKNQKYEDIKFIKNINDVKLGSMLHHLPFALTLDQEKILKNTVKCLKSEKKLQKLVLGDVGSGKTIIAILITNLLIESGYQVAIMAPTEVLAKQLFSNFKMYLKDFKIELLTGSVSKIKKNQIKDNLVLGITKVVVGTHALITKDVEFKNLALAIIDEQHRFGVEQRNMLIRKTMYEEFLYLSATPIPRTLAQSIFGVIDIEFIETKPQNRIPIETKIITDRNKKDAYVVLENELQKKHQAFIVAPTIEETEIENLENVENIYEKMVKFYENKYKIGLIHGLMKSKDKDKIMEKFQQSEYDILVATTVIEVGVNIPNATVMLVINAERYGLAQLHQLRGRVGRSKFKSYCFLYDKSNNELSKKRLKLLRDTDDGFVLAQEDLKIRGSGNFFGKKQSGEAGFKLFDYYEDAGIAKKVIEDYKFKIQ